MLRNRLFLVLLTTPAALLAAACSSSSASPTSDASTSPDSPTSEAGEDAPAEAQAEASTDTGSDAPSETASDASSDADGASDASDATPDADAGAAIPVAVITDAPKATALLTDGTDLFWIDSVTTDAGTTGRVMKASVTGGTETTLASIPGASTVRIALDGANVYFTDNNNNVWTVPKAGGGPSLLVTSNQSAPLAGSNGVVYYGEGNGLAKISSSPDAGADASAGTVLSTSGDPVDLVVVAGDVFWANPTAGALQYVSASTGGSPTTLLGPDPDAGTGEFVSTTAAQNLITNGTSLYWNRAPGAGIPGAVMSLPVGGGAPSVVINTGTDTPFSVVTDGNSAFYLDLGTTTSLVQLSLGTGTAVTLATTDLSAAGIAGTPGPTVAVDTAHVYWLDPPNIFALPK